MNELVADTPTAALAPARLGALAAEIAADRSRWSAQAHHDRHRRCFEQLGGGADHDVWVVGWSPGQAIAAHDHGGSAGAVVVVEGALVETRWRAPGGPVARALDAADGPLVVDTGTVHAVANLGARVATSIHVYSPPLGPLRWFETAGATVTARPERDRVGSAPAIEGLLAGARARLQRPTPEEAWDAARHAGALLVDIRPERDRRAEGGLPLGVVVERTVLEWRLDPSSPDRLAEAADPSRSIILVCNEGYSSSLAAATLQELGVTGATDLVGGFRAWAGAGLPTVPVVG